MKEARDRDTLTEPVRMGPSCRQANVRSRATVSALSPLVVGIPPLRGTLAFGSSPLLYFMQGKIDDACRTNSN